MVYVVLHHLVLVHCSNLHLHTIYMPHSLYSSILPCSKTLPHSNAFAPVIPSVCNVLPLTLQIVNLFSFFKSQLKCHFIKDAPPTILFKVGTPPLQLLTYPTLSFIVIINPQLFCLFTCLLFHFPTRLLIPQEQGP